MTLDVNGPRSGERRDATRKVCCAMEERNVDLKFVKSRRIGGERGYVKSLNYLPNVNFEEDAEENFVKPSTDPVGPKEGKKGFTTAGVDDSDDDNNDGEDNITMEQNGEEEATESMFQKEQTNRIIKLLKGRGGVPISYPHQEVEKIKASSYSRNFTNDLVILTVSVGLHGYMYNPIMYVTL